MEAIRIEKIRKQLKLLDIDALLITKPCNRKYMSGFTGSAGYILLTHNDCLLFTDFRYVSQANAEAKIYQVIQHDTKATDTIRKWLHDLNVRRLGIEQNDVTYGTYLTWHQEFGDFELVPTKHVVESARAIKDDTELNMMRKATAIADAAFAHIITLMKPGMKERDVAAELEYFIRMNGATSSAFPMIIASGERSALPHGYASDRRLQNNEFVTMDFGAQCEGYLSDLTRTVFLGTPSTKHEEVYNIVLEANLETLKKLKPGMNGIEADALGRDIIKKHGYGDNFGHGLGHGVGLEIHEAERFSVDSAETVMKPGMVMTVEPGIYIPGLFGVRIEDDIVITETGIELLTKSPKELILL